VAEILMNSLAAWLNFTVLYMIFQRFKIYTIKCFT